jgi:N-acetylmuramoyl-L-alanine amidase
VLKSWNLIGLAAGLAGFLAACSTPPTTSREEATPVSPPVIVNVTNPPPDILPAIVTNTPPPSEPAPPSVPEPVPPPEPPLQAKPSQRAVSHKWLAWESWSQGSGWGTPQRLHNTGAWTYELKSTNGVLEITAGNRTALWNGLNLELGFAPRLTNGQPYIHGLDLAKTFEPLTLQPAFLHRSNRVIVIDPGHGGENYGAKSALGPRFEKEFALDWAFRLEGLLKAQGWQVFLTRTNDVDVSLADRTAFADLVNADLFISLHFNSTDQPQGHSKQGGLESYCLTPVGMPSTLTRRFDDELSHCYPNNSFDAENYHFAARLQRAMVQATHRKDRGVRRARFMGVLRGQNRPAVLLEGGYLTDPEEARLIATLEFRQKLAEAVARALSE